MIKYFYFLPVIFFCISSFTSYTWYNFIKVDPFFEILLLFVFILCSKRMRGNWWFISYGLLCYSVVILFLSMNNNDVAIRDFFIAYKSIFYLIMLSFFVGKVFFKPESVLIFFRFLLFVFFIKYILWFFLSSTDRPGVFAENNFEIVFILLVSLSVFKVNDKVGSLENTILFLVVMFSGSRSGIVCLFAMYFILYARISGYKAIFSCFFLLVFSLIISFVFFQRLSGGSLESIDRVVFLQSLIMSISDWSILNYLFGNFFLSPLAEEACTRLSFYTSLFSVDNPGICYSVILHAYVLRIFYDFGLLGLIFIFYITFQMIIKSNVKSKIAFAALAVIFLSGLSVSSLNSVYTILGLIILMCSGKKNNEVWT